MRFCFARAYEDRFEPQSAEIIPTQINPYVIKAMAEIGIDISKKTAQRTSKNSGGSNFNYIVTVCDSAMESCPFLPDEKIIYKAFKARAHSQFKGSEEEILKGVRQVREEMREKIKGTFG